MKQSNLVQFKFEDKKCTGFITELADMNIVFVKDVHAVQDVWKVQVLDMPNLLPMAFEMPKTGMSLVKVAEFGISCLLGQVRNIQGNLEELALEINKELMRSDNGK